MVEEGNQEKKKVLVIEDEEMLRTALSRHLEKAGYDVSTAVDGEEGISKIKNILPHIIILDILMPKLDGIEVLRKAKEDFKTKDIPVLLLTNSPDEVNVSSGLELGAKAYLVKSNYSLKDVVDKIKGFIN